MTVITRRGTSDHPITVADLRAFLRRCDETAVPDATVIEALDCTGASGIGTGHDLTAIRTKRR